jgi:hypothetical protein
MCFVCVCVCVCVCEGGGVCLVVARQRLGAHIPAGTTTYATTDELSDEVFRMRSVSHQMITSERNIGC